MTLALKRLGNWRTRMAANHQLAVASPFVWGSHDCAQYAAKHIEAVTGVNVMPPELPQYDSPIGSIRALKAIGCTSLLDFCEKSFPPIKVAYARVADLALINTDPADGTGWAIGIVLGAMVGVLAPTGYALLPRSHPTVQYAFMIGN